MNEVYFRDFGDDTRALCPHIQIVGEFYRDEDAAQEAAEYIVGVRIVCNVCTTTHYVNRVVG